MGLPVFPGLPQPPNVQGGVLTPPGAGLQGFKPSLPANIVSGVNDFVQNYLGSREAIRQHFNQKFQQGIYDKMLGIPVNDEELAKWAKKADIPIRLDPYTPQELEYQKAQAAQTQAQSTAQSQLQSGNLPPGMQAPATPGAPPGGVDPSVAQMMMTRPPNPMGPVPPPPPQARPGFFGRLGNAMGLTNPPPGAGTPGVSPFGDWLGSLSKAAGVGGGLPGQVARQGLAQSQESQMGTQEFELRSLANQIEKNMGIDIKKMSMQQQQALLGQITPLIAGAMTGNPQAVEMLTRSGILKDLPGDETVRAANNALAGTMDPTAIRRAAGNLFMYEKGGYRQLQIAQMDAAKTLLPHFGNDYGKALQYVTNPFGSGLMPNWSVDDLDKWASYAKNFSEAAPLAPPDLIMHYANGKLTGNEALSNAAMGAITSHYPKEMVGNTRGAIQAYEAGTSRGQLGVAQGRLGVDKDTLLLKTYTDLNGLNQAAARVIGENAGKEMETAFNVLRDSSASPQARQSAIDMLASSQSRLANVTVPYNGKQIPLGDVMKRVNEQRLTNPIQDLFLGGVPQLQLNTPLWADPRAQKLTQGLSPAEQGAVLPSGSPWFMPTPIPPR